MMLTMPKCYNCGKFCRPVEWKMIYSGALPEPQEEIYKCAACAEKHGSFVPQHGIKPEYSCGSLTHNAVAHREAACGRSGGAECSTAQTTESKK
jgi:hypothetical protein